MIVQLVVLAKTLESLCVCWKLEEAKTLPWCLLHRNSNLNHGGSHSSFSLVFYQKILHLFLPSFIPPALLLTRLRRRSRRRPRRRHHTLLNRPLPPPQRGRDRPCRPRQDHAHGPPPPPVRRRHPPRARHGLYLARARARHHHRL